jgi:hypothetical protein
MNPKSIPRSKCSGARGLWRRMFRRRYRLRYPISFLLAGRQQQKLNAFRVNTREIPSNCSSPPTFGRLPEKVKRYFDALNPAFSRSKDTVYHIRRRALVDSNTGLVFEAGCLLTMPLVDDLSYRERLVAGSAFRVAVGEATEFKETSLVLLRHPWEDNYYHIINDILPKLSLAAIYTDLRNATIIVGPSLKRSVCFQFMIQRNEAYRHLKFVVAGGPIATKNLIIPTVAMSSRRNFESLLDDLPIDRKPHLDGTRRLFVSRRSIDGRALDNLDGVEQILSRYKFEKAFPGDLSFEEQVKLFASAQYVVGIHGAGLTNIIFRAGGRLSLLELFAPEGINPHYYNICGHFGFSYNAMVGEASQVNLRSGRLGKSAHYKNFRVDESLLEKNLREMLGFHP